MSSPTGRKGREGRRRGRDSAAVERTIAALRRVGRLEDVDAAKVALVRSTAEALDRARAEGEGAAGVASLARVHLQALKLLTPEVAADDRLGDFLAALAADVPTSMGDTEDPEPPY